VSAKKIEMENAAHLNSLPEKKGRSVLPRGKTVFVGKSRTMGAKASEAQRGKIKSQVEGPMIAVWESNA